MSIREFVVGPGDGQLVGSNPWFERVPKGKQCLGQSEVYFLSSVPGCCFGCLVVLAEFMGWCAPDPPCLGRRRR